ncbi:MAG: low specificity L-threonine aldolase [Myxococcales bacterium]|nr:low specificity L-threonine aldolase [Myxococcales bacterium]
MKMIDLRSDTVTRPTPEMLNAMCTAPLGDDVLGDEPTVQKLEAKVAEMTGKETAVFVPSGTMANQIAIWLHTKPGDGILVEENSHILHYEAAGPAMIAGVKTTSVPGQNGIMDVEKLKTSFPPDDPHCAPVTLVCAEDTANRGGGYAYPIETLDAIAQTAQDNQARCHLDGARLFNAQVKTGVSAARRAAQFDTVSICFSKGLGAPVGSALCLPQSMRRDAIRARKMLGGGMRQSGVIAAAALYALEHHVDRLAEDHQKAITLAEGLKQHGYEVVPPQTNMVYFKHPKAQQILDQAEQQGVRALTAKAQTVRLVTHLDVNESDIEKSIEIFGKLLNS